jgi:hypothetical protein
MISFIFLLNGSALAPNIACTPPPTSNTPVAPNFLILSLSTFLISLTATLSLVIQASTSSRFSFPPRASKT